MANVFVSYRGPGAVTAIRLASELRDAGHQVWLDEWEVGLGASIIGRMSEGLVGDAYLVLCISRHGMDASWMGPEWLSELARQLRAHGVRLLPARVEGGEPPAILTNLRYADLSADWAGGLAELQRIMG